MARIFVQTVSHCICTQGFSFVPSAVCGKRLNAFAGIQHVIDVTVLQRHYVPSIRILLSARRNYRKTRQLSHLTIEEQFILRVSGVVYCLCDGFSLIPLFYHRAFPLRKWCHMSARFIVAVVGFSPCHSQGISATSIIAMLHAISTTPDVNVANNKWQWKLESPYRPHRYVGQIGLLYCAYIRCYECYHADTIGVEVLYCTFLLCNAMLAWYMLYVL